MSAEGQTQVRVATLTGVAALLGLALGFSFGDLGPIARDLGNEYAVSLSFVGLMIAVLAMMHALSQIPSGRLVDRVGAKRVALLGLAILAGTNALAALLPLPAVALVLRLVMGIGTGLGFIAGTQYVRQIGAVSQGIFGGAVLFGQGVAIVAMPFVAGPLGWRAPWLAALVIAVLAGILLASGPPGAPPARDPMKGADGNVPMRPMVRDTGLYRIASMHAADMGLAIVVGNWSVLLLTGTAGLPAETAGVIGSLTLVLGAIARPIGGWLLRLRPRQVRASLVLGMLGCSLGTVLLAFGGGATTALVGAVLVGLGGGISYAPAFGAAAYRWPESPGAAIGLVNMMAVGVVIVGAPVMGATFDGPMGGQIGFAAIALLWCCAAFAVPTTRQLALDEASPLGHPADAHLLT